MKEETKIRIPLWIYPSTNEQVTAHYEAENCKSPSEFIEKAIKFYCGYLDSESNVHYLSAKITDSVDAVVRGAERRISRNLFKIAVELGKISHIIASQGEIDDETLRELHALCVNEVRRINGTIDFESAVEFQND